MELLEIAKLPTAENSAIQLHSNDNIAVARVPLAAGQVLKINGNEITVRDAVPAGHKVALRRIAPGESVVRYGQMMGPAKVQIEPGSHVHVHNVGYEELTLAYEFPTGEVPFPAPPKSMPTFLGFPREDGRVGTRNYIAVVAASNCAAHTAEWIASSFEGETLPPNVDGIAAFPHGDGCGMAFGPDTDQLRRTLAGVLHHPNVSAAIILGLGCEVNQIDHYLGPERAAHESSGRNDAPGNGRDTRYGRGRAQGNQETDGARGGRKARGSAGFEDCSWVELRRVRFVLRYYRESRARFHIGHAGGNRGDRRCWPRPLKLSARNICW